MLQILYEIVFSPRIGFKKAIKENSLLGPSILISAIGLINGFAITETSGQPGLFSLLYVVALLIFWFSQSAFLNLIGELLGGKKGGKALFICIGYTIFPFLFLTPFHSFSEPIFVAASLILLVWVIWLEALAMEEAQDITFRKAIFACLLPIVVYVIVSFSGIPFTSRGS